MPPPTPSLLGPYAVEHALDHGGTSTVLLGRHRWLDRVVAIKLRTRSTDEDDAVLTERFRLGGMVQAELSHPHIAQVFDYLETATHQALVMEFLGGGSLEDVLRTGPLSLGSAVMVAVGAGRALQYAHERGVVHRDIKPANLLLADRTRPATVRVNDFGVARSERLSRDLTSPGAHVGTLWYMPPEQFDGGRVSPAGDTYSLAATTFELLTGTLPFDRVDTAEIFRRFLDRVPPPPVRSRNPAVPPALALLVEQGLALDPAARTPSAGLFALGLQALASHAGLVLDDEALIRSLVGEGARGLVAHLAAADPQAGQTLSEALAGLHARLRGGHRLDVGLVTPAVIDPTESLATHELNLTASLLADPGDLLEHLMMGERSETIDRPEDDGGDGEEDDGGDGEEDDDGEDDDEDHTLVMRAITDD